MPGPDPIRHVIGRPTGLDNRHGQRLPAVGDGQMCRCANVLGQLTKHR
jgi:hypothetical protein